MPVLDRSLPRVAPEVTDLHRQVHAQIKQRGGSLGRVLQSLGLIPSAGGLRPDAPMPVAPRANRPAPSL